MIDRMKEKEMAMTKHHESLLTSINRRPRSLRHRMFDVEPYFRQEPASFTEVVENLKLKGFLKRAVSRETAPESLIDSIRAGIRG